MKIEVLMDSERSNQPAPIYTVSVDSEEYTRQREAQFKQGLKTLARSLLLFGGLLLLWIVLINLP